MLRAEGEKVFIGDLCLMNMASEGVQMPGGMGGLMRYDEEFKSKLMMSPAQVIGFIVIVILFVIGLKIFWPVG